MILCLCRVVTDSKVREVIAEGALDPDEVGRRCGAGTDCGSCLDDIEELIACHGGGRRECGRQSSQDEAVYPLRRAS